MKLSTTVFLILTLFVFSNHALADGKAFSGRDFSSLYPVVENEQRAAIVHRDGIERMIIAISLELEDQDNALWIFPVLGRPDNVKLDILDSFPRFLGRDPRQTARNIIGGAGIAALSTQIYPIVVTAVLFPSMRGIPGISIHGEIEKWGIHAETATAKSTNSLAAYLKQKNVRIEKGELAAFKDYLSDKYVLVIVWISSREQLLKQFPEYEQFGRPGWERWPCLYVEFPTERAFYPLRPTSTYGNQEIPIHLVVINYVKPQTSPDLAEKLKVRYYEQLGFPQKIPKKFLEALPSEAISYTTINFRGSAQELTDDLWFSPTQPKGIKYAEVILTITRNKFVLVFSVLAFIACVSYISAGLSGLILFGKWKGYAELGFYNLYTLIGLYFTTRRVKGAVGERLRNPKEKPARRTFLAVFSFLFLLSTLALTTLFSLPLL